MVFTTQNPVTINICPNVVATAQRKKDIDGYQIIEYKPVAEINCNNISTLRFLDLMDDIDQYGEIIDDEYKYKI